MTNLILGIGAILAVVIVLIITMVLAFKVVIENNQPVAHRKAKNGDVKLDEIARKSKKYLKLTNLESYEN